MRGCRLLLNIKIRPRLLRTDLKVDVSVWQPGGAAFVQEVDVFDEEAEEGDHDLEDGNNSSHRHFTLWSANVKRSLTSPPHLLLATVGSLRPLRGATESGAVVAEVTGRVHLVLWRWGTK